MCCMHGRGKCCGLWPPAFPRSSNSFITWNWFVHKFSWFLKIRNVLGNNLYINKLGRRQFWTILIRYNICTSRGTCIVRSINLPYYRFKSCFIFIKTSAITRSLYTPMLANFKYTSFILCYINLSSTFFYILRHSLTFFDILLHSSTFFDILWHYLTFFDILRHSSTFFDIRPHSSTFFNILQHSSTFYDILRHSSIFCDIYSKPNLKVKSI